MKTLTDSFEFVYQGSESCYNVYYKSGQSTLVAKIYGSRINFLAAEIPVSQVKEVVDFVEKRQKEKKFAQELKWIMEQIHGLIEETGNPSKKVLTLIHQIYQEIDK